LAVEPWIISIRFFCSITSIRIIQKTIRPGFPMHPHRGIETVTYVLSGEVKHKDSLGNSGSIGAGDVQWMTAGAGNLHEEMPQVRPEGGERVSALGQLGGEGEDDRAALPGH
jgi:redox-sensitive bicupin YhaK (pirin superfamily)